IELRGNFDQALEIVREVVARHSVELVNSINPYRIEGQKTAAFEVCDELGAAPVASAIRIGNPARWKEAEEAFEQSGGTIAAVSDEEILAAQKWLASVEGVFCEPASAASVAGVLKSPPDGALLVCVLTGHGLKDPEIVLEQAEAA